jgi:hypothetical protein
MKGDGQLRGSFFLVMVLGVLMIVGWWVIFDLYLSRQ